jgi:hypothetical protein
LAHGGHQQHRAGDRTDSEDDVNDEPSHEYRTFDLGAVDEGEPDLVADDRE